MTVIALVLALVVLLFGGIPILLLTRAGPRARLAAVRPRALAAWWLLAALPWIAAWTWILRGDTFTIAIEGTADAVRAIAAAVLALLVLVSFPTAVVTATWLRLRGADGAADGAAESRR